MTTTPQQLDKPAVFAAAARALRPGGRLALADIVSATQLPEGVTCDASLWAACIGGHAARRLPRDDRARGLREGGMAREHGVPVRVGTGRQRHTEVRGHQHFGCWRDARRQAIVAP